MTRNLKSTDFKQHEMTVDTTLSKPSVEVVRIVVESKWSTRLLKRLAVYFVVNILIQSVFSFHRLLRLTNHNILERMKFSCKDYPVYNHKNK